MITIEELQQAFEKHATKSMSASKIRQIMKNVDYMGNGKINYTEFLAATVSVHEVLTEAKLLALFKHFDTDNSDYITPDNIREAFQQGGRKLTSQQTKQILSSHDFSGDGRLNFDAFRAIFYDSQDYGRSPQMCTPTTGTEANSNFNDKTTPTLRSLRLDNQFSSSCGPADVLVAESSSQP